GARAERRDDGGGGGGLGEAVPLVDEDAGGVEEEVEVAFQRGAAADGVAQAAAEFLADAAVDEQVVERPGGVQGGARALAAAEEPVEVRGAEADGEAVGAFEGGAAADPLGGGAAGVVDLLEEVGHADEEGRAERLEGGPQFVRLDAREVADLDAGRQTGDLEGAAEDVGEREEQQCR